MRIDQTNHPFAPGLPPGRLNLRGTLPFLQGRWYLSTLPGQARLGREQKKILQTQDIEFVPQERGTPFGWIQPETAQYVALSRSRIAHPHPTKHSQNLFQ